MSVVCCSGGHFNPACTLGVLVCGAMSWWLALVYFVAQILGAILGAALTLVSCKTGKAFYFIAKFKNLAFIGRTNAL